MSLTQQLADLMPDATQLESNEPGWKVLCAIQLALLLALFRVGLADQTDFFIGANLTIYFSRQQL
jgi:Uma2 family endonuclease